MIRTTVPDLSTLLKSATSSSLNQQLAQPTVERVFGKREVMAGIGMSSEHTRKPLKNDTVRLQTCRGQLDH
jgi:hypothetical protein